MNRLTIGLTDDLYRHFSQMGEDQGRSIADVIRDALYDSVLQSMPSGDLGAIEDDIRLGASNREVSKLLGVEETFVAHVRRRMRASEPLTPTDFQATRRTSDR